MQEMCLERAKQVREEMERLRSHQTHPSLLSAERLLLLEALDMVCVYVCSYII